MERDTLHTDIQGSSPGSKDAAEHLREAMSRTTRQEVFQFYVEGPLTLDSPRRDKGAYVLSVAERVGRLQARNQVERDQLPLFE